MFAYEFVTQALPQSFAADGIFRTIASILRARQSNSKRPSCGSAGDL
jgi:hypothetical protein